MINDNNPKSLNYIPGEVWLANIRKFLLGSAAGSSSSTTNGESSSSTSSSEQSETTTY